jgi:glycosyltransferase involved in cell wall biosynthesis
MKYPPIQGGVSARCFWIAQALAKEGHDVFVVTNAAEVEEDYRLNLLPGDEAYLDGNRFDGTGSVTVTYTGSLVRRLAHVPHAQPFVTKLTSLALQEVRQNDCDLLFSYYLEPYGVSGYMASTWTGLPHVVQHAGSDRMRLMAHPELALTYSELLRSAACVVTAGDTLQGLGIPATRLSNPCRALVPEDWFNPHAESLDIAAVVDHFHRIGHPSITNIAPMPDRPTLGIYGKVGVPKGSFDLIAALDRLRRTGLPFNLLAMVGGTERRRFCEAISEAGLEDRTWTIPFLPHWRVPGFIRACTAVCFLERRFPIPVHTPVIPSEVMLCGTCLVVSEEVARKQPCWPHFVDGENAIIVRDPEDLDELTVKLTTALEDPQRASDMGRASAGLVSSVTTGELGRFYAELFERICAEHSTARPGRPTEVQSDDQSGELNEVRAQLTRYMPISTRRLERLISDSLAEFCAEQGSRPEGPLHTAYAYATFLVDRLLGEAVEITDGPTIAVARFEREKLWLAVDVESRSGVPEFPRRSVAAALRRATQNGTDPDDLRPARTNWLHMLDVDYDVDALVQTDKTESGMGSPPSVRPMSFLFHKRGNLMGRVYRTSKPVRSLLQLCDGSRTAREIAVALRRESVSEELTILSGAGLILLS